MAIELIPNQLVKLYDTENFNQRNKRLTWDYRQYCQIVRDEQTTQFQVRLTAATGANLVTNGDFESNYSNWLIYIGTVGTNFNIATGQVLQIIKDGLYAPTIYQTITTEANTQYKCTVDVLQLLGSGDAEVGFSVLASITDVKVNVAFDKATYGSTPGQLDFYFYSGSSTSLQLYISFDGQQGDIVYLTNVEIVKLTEPVVTLEDTGGTTIETLTPFARALDVITYQVEWAEKTEQQYRICITGVDDLNLNYLDKALALKTEGGEPIELQQGGYLKWYG